MMRLLEPADERGTFARARGDERRWPDGLTELEKMDKKTASGEFGRDTAEKGRERAEARRQDAEAARALAEQRRLELEAVRHEREELRHAAEEARQTAEQARHATIAAVVATADSLSANLAQMQFMEDAREILRQLKRNQPSGSR